MVVIFMMTNVQNTAKKIIKPFALAIAMLFMTPVVGLLSAGLNSPAPLQYSSNETVVYKTPLASVAYKG
ncbi:MAG: hypothetical protein Q8M18_19815 [Bradyrhizobium sp.]|nr:hypothetical protein [Bradyrhizobium sp.]